jgi:hypothetical protein
MKTRKNLFVADSFLVLFKNLFKACLACLDTFQSLCDSVEFEPKDYIHLRKDYIRLQADYTRLQSDYIRLQADYIHLQKTTRFCS